MSDEALLNLAWAGGREAREELARRYRGPAYVLALQLLNHPEDALDVAQESMLRFFATLGRVEPTRPLRPWLLAIVRNQVRDFWRRRRVRRTESLDGPAGQLGEPADPLPDPEEAAEQAQLRRQVWRAIAALSPEQREIIVLRDFHGLSYQEIADVISIRPGTVMSRLHGARRQLRALLAKGLSHA